MFFKSKKRIEAIKRINQKKKATKYKRYEEIKKFLFSMYKNKVKVTETQLMRWYKDAFGLSMETFKNDIKDLLKLGVIRKKREFFYEYVTDYSFPKKSDNFVKNIIKLETMDINTILDRYRRGDEKKESEDKGGGGI